MGIAIGEPGPALDAREEAFNPGPIPADEKSIPFFFIENGISLIAYRESAGSSLENRHQVFRAR